MCARQEIDTFVCVHQRDVDYLLGPVLACHERNYQAGGRLRLVTNDVPYLRDYLDRTGRTVRVDVSDDREWLSTAEAALPGWFKQQIVKLRSFRFCETDNFCNLGSDTLLLRPITSTDLVEGGLPVTYYHRHLLPNPHLWMEMRRLYAVSRMLGIVPRRAMWLVDFVTDLFCFRREWLVGLDEFLRDRFGPNPFATLLSGLDARRHQHRFGEWTLYSCFVLDVLKAPVATRQSGRGYLAQIHSRRDLRRFRFDTKVAHFVQKDFDVSEIQARLGEAGPERGRPPQDRPDRLSGSAGSPC